MKKNRFPVMMIALAAAALLGITVWRAALENGAQEEKKTSLRIGVLLYRGDDTFIGTLRSSMEQAAKEAGLSFTTFYRRLKVAKISTLRKENIQQQKTVS